MGLSASMWTGVSGLSAHGEKMSVIGNNIANVNTVGFKGSRMYFEDFFSQDISTASGFGQVGRGVTIGAVYGVFAQGAFENTSEATDLAIGGDGFFRVKPKGEETEYYTRAGNFRFDKDGYLVDPHGYVLQGWEIERDSAALATTSSGASNETASATKIKGTGVPKNVRLDGFTAQPKNTNSVTMITNLDARDGGDNATSATDPYFSMFSIWDATQDEPIGESRFAYQSTIKVYDEGGSARNMTVYFDQVSVSNSGGKRYWEYMVTVDPSDDGRTLNGVDMSETSAAGVLMIGTLTFDAAGQIENQSAFTLPSTVSGDFKDLSNWKVADFNTDGYPICVPNFTRVEYANATDSAQSNAAARAIGINFGVVNADPVTDGGWDTTVYSNAGQIQGSSNYDRIPGYKDPEPEALATTSFAGSSSTMFQSQDGYTFGFLQNVSVDRDGILSGRYSNGEILELYQITLYDFVNPWDLRREGGNLFSETRESGAATPGPANANGLGSINSNSLEQSNVDLAEEFVKMITTERGFQANSKVITSVDMMLQTVIMMKR
jgi:flagellar hook protein FlgE